MKSIPRVVAAGGAVLALAGSAFAANEIAGRDRPPAATTLTIDSTAPLFTEAGLVNGQTFERCTTLTNEGPQPADVTLFGNASQSDLSPWLGLVLVRGSLPSGTAPGDCTGFTPDAEDWGDGTPGVVFRGSLSDLPGDDSGIADPTRWAVGERHAYLLRVHYTGDNPQQGLSTTESFSWGATPYDDRPPDPFQDPSTQPGATPTPSATTPDTTPTKIPTSRECTIVTFPTRSFIGARALSQATRVSKKAKSKKATRSALSSSDATVVSGGENLSTLTPGVISHRQKVLAETAHRSARRTPVLAVRLAPGKKNTLVLRVGLRKNGFLTSPHRWRWVRVRINSGSTNGTLKWPFTATARMTQLKTGYNQLDLTLNRGNVKVRPHGLPAVLRRSFGFVVGDPSATGPATGTDCTLG